jgi:5-oxoprolinase (ATP-hydrolysing) subunit A
MARLKLNCDVGEQHHLLESGIQAELLAQMDWANIACGGHAGDEGLMAATLEQCLMFQVQAGAHPSFPDRVYFGREAMEIPEAELEESILHQLHKLDWIANRLKIPLRHVKPHGALYNQAAYNEAMAKTVARAVGRWNRQVTLVGLAGSDALSIWEEMGFRTAAEAFADRRYDSSGRLRPRALSQAVIHDAAEAAEQATRIARLGEVVSHDGKLVPIQAETICLHSDSPRVLQLLKEIRARLPKEERAPTQMSF